MGIRVIINGINGKMGRVLEKSIATRSDFTLVAGIGRGDNLSRSIQSTNADVVVDFTTAQAVFKNTEIIIQSGARPVIGTTGLTLKQIATLNKQSRIKKLGGIVAPNFSFGAVLMMKYAKDAARYFADAEIIEMHHSQKIDAPSGTAIKTAQMMQQSRLSKSNKKAHEDHMCSDIKHDITIHSVRLPGLFSHQLVIFGGDGETLTIRHDGTDRSCVIPGVFLACQKVMELHQLIYGLENILNV
ncbi:4-hydroxy-tetrahydrodipicolinate reductase [Coxiella endosymbiont of Amblyomma nuttalli]|uniref:4-hydroxy-tetrahydrodipicolinate reductase n=1 Tax=Coxiella endosymbiont of Amblyomma nuttalli TaxID=2749996 RepID=UPI001BA9440E|nr:4-hydroxy-tetrahydrodipicolinate reductase [Coxiella endosymbiont of Amblyomma nuttalli]QTS83733.1 4-hydroxy-tetrahydrodipicolinate reductase [Coxiella endosymbiont of Amblyomma nuttalli]